MTLLFKATLAAALLSASPSADLTHDEIVLRTPVPSSEKRHGEVRVVRRGEMMVVQTVLRSKVLRRVAGEIAEKEARGWPDGVEGAGESARYVEALRSTVDAIRGAHRRPAAGERDRYREMRIDFFIDRGQGVVVLSGAEVADDGDVLRLAGARDPVEVLELSAGYVARNMCLIVEDAFGGRTEDAARLLPWCVAGADGLP